MAYLPGVDGRIKKRVLMRKGFWGDHLDELSAIVRGENRRGIMHPVTGWASRPKLPEPEPEQPAQKPEVPNPGTPKTRKGRTPVPFDREALVALWNSDAPLWAIAKAFGVVTNTLYVRAKACGLSKRGHVASRRKRRGTVKMGPEHGGS